MADVAAQVALGEALADVGRLRFSANGPRQFSTFSYAPTWSSDPAGFAIAPDLPLDGGPFHASANRANDAAARRDALSGVFADAAPDAWGRRLLEQAYGNGLTEFEYLTLSDDQCRQGALRFLNDEGAIIRGGAPAPIPRLVELSELTGIARAYEQGQDIGADKVRLLAGAAGSGGARPKANVTDGETLWLAKFTSVLDQSPVERVEIATLDLARACGIRVPVSRLELSATDFPVALIARFDRRGTARIPYISARTALQKPGTEAGSYTGIVDFMRGHSPDPSADFRELFLRLVFTILVSNKDDHLKNHGFIYTGASRWRLSPMFDVNPAPDRNPWLETAILDGGAHDRSIILALEASAFFDLPEAQARAIIRETAVIVARGWKDALRRAGLTGSQIREYEPAFVHQQSKLALEM